MSLYMILKRGLYERAVAFSTQFRVSSIKPKPVIK